MTSDPSKMAVALLLGFVLAWHGVWGSAARIGATERAAQRSCCGTSCDNSTCVTQSCCVKPGAPSVPVAPASLPSATKDEFHALAVSGVPVLSLPLRPARYFAACPASSDLVTAVPLFQRDCAWLI